MSNIDINFQTWDLQQRSYTTEDVLPTIKRVELIGKNKFAVATLDSQNKAFVVYIIALNISSHIDDKVYLSKSAQIDHLKIDKALTEVPNKYANTIIWHKFSSNFYSNYETNSS